MRTTKCDVCGRTEPEIYCRYNKKKMFGWFQSNSDSGGSYETEQDLCEQCWEGFKDYMKARLKKRGK